MLIPLRLSLSHVFQTGCVQRLPVRVNLMQAALLAAFVAVLWSGSSLIEWMIRHGDKP